MDRPLRITFVLPHAGFHGGIRVCAIYAQALQQRGHHVEVVSLPPERPSVRMRVRALVRGQALEDQRGGHFDNLPITHRVLERVRPVTDRDVPEADVVIATWWETAEWVARLSPAKGQKVYFIQHDERGFYNQPRERVAATWRLPLYRITIAPWLVELGRAEFGIEQITLVPNGVDPELFFAPPRTKRPTPTVGMMTSSAAFKGTDVALAAFALAARDVKGLELVAFGQDDLELPVGARFVKRPAQSQIRELYSACDAWLFASRSEGFGLPILEAMACRTPVIGTPAGAAPALIGEGGGMLVQPEDPQDMARAIRTIVGLSAAEWTGLSDRAYATAQRNTWGLSIDRFEAALREAASR
jgi:glycosyltransferase involved in cell wall biosynthesis